jgi:hypothetical protein
VYPPPFVRSLILQPNFGTCFSREIVPKLAIDPNILLIEQEVAGANCARDAEGANLDPDGPDESETIIICAALLETGHAGLPAGIPIMLWAWIHMKAVHVLPWVS